VDVDGFTFRGLHALNRNTILMPDANWLNLGKIGMAKIVEVDGLAKA
jgi:hypothetical protein